jgi:hypothetical protein
VKEKETGRNSAIDQNTRHIAVISDRIHQITDSIRLADRVVSDTAAEAEVSEVDNDPNPNQNIISMANRFIFSNNVQQKSNPYDANITEPYKE